MKKTHWIYSLVKLDLLQILKDSRWQKGSLLHGHFFRIISPSTQIQISLLLTYMSTILVTKAFLSVLVGSYIMQIPKQKSNFHIPSGRILSITKKRVLASKNYFLRSKKLYNNSPSNLGTKRVSINLRPFGNQRFSSLRIWGRWNRVNTSWDFTSSLCHDD